jgi:hypothetical protein
VGRRGPVPTGGERRTGADTCFPLVGSGEQEGTHARRAWVEGTELGARGPTADERVRRRSPAGYWWQRQPCRAAGPRAWKLAVGETGEARQAELEAVLSAMWGVAGEVKEVGLRRPE